MGNGQILKRSHPLPITHYPLPITHYSSPLTRKRPMTGFIRRVVTGHDKSGRAIVISDGIAPNVKTNPSRAGHRSSDIWKTSAMPVVLAADETDPTLGPRTLHPAPQGTVI